MTSSSVAGFGFFVDVYLGVGFLPLPLADRRDASGVDMSDASDSWSDSSRKPSNSKSSSESPEKASSLPEPSSDISSNLTCPC